MYPFVEQKINSYQKIRSFSESVKTEELTWHKDMKDRVVEVLAGEGWEFQLDNCLPIPLTAGDMLLIPANTYHRVKRGSNKLVVRITETDG
jgi:quercetin dioxygenase-like cupin family protein